MLIVLIVASSAITGIIASCGRHGGKEHNADDFLPSGIEKILLINGTIKNTDPITSIAMTLPHLSDFTINAS